MKKFIQPNIFQYYPSEIYGSYEFFYESYRRLQYWFIYNSFPYHGKYWFYYDFVADINIVNTIVGTKVVRDNQTRISKSLSNVDIFNDTREIKNISLEFYAKRMNNERIYIEEYNGHFERKRQLTSVSEYLLLNKNKEKFTEIKEEKKTTYISKENLGVIKTLEDTFLLRDIEELVIRTIESDIVANKIYQEVGTREEATQVNRVTLLEGNLKDEREDVSKEKKYIGFPEGGEKYENFTHQNINTTSQEDGVGVNRLIENNALIVENIEGLNKQSKESSNSSDTNSIEKKNKGSKIENKGSGIIKKPKYIEEKQKEEGTIKKAKDIKALSPKEVSKDTIKKSKDISFIEGEVGSIKDFKDIEIEEVENLSKGLYRDSSQESGIVEEIKAELDFSRDLLIEEVERDFIKGTSEAILKKGEKITREGKDGARVHEEERTNKSSKGMTIEDLDKQTLKREKLTNIDNNIVDNLEKKEKDMLVSEIEKGLKLHSRWWFLDKLGEVDWKILPNKDANYPPNIDMMLFKPEGTYIYKYETSYKTLRSIYANQKPYIIEVYDEDYQMIDTLVVNAIANGTYRSNFIKLDINIIETEPLIFVKYNILIKQDIGMSYIIIREPKNQEGVNVIFATTPKFIENKHPIPLGSDMGLKEIPIDINIMVDFLNILFMMWHKFYLAFTGYTGVNAIYGMINVLHEWLNLETSLEEETIEEYHRCFRWFRWEAEKVHNRAKKDPDDNGNYWVGEVIYELIEYMESHHFNCVPFFEDLANMDEQRNIFQNATFEVEAMVEKMKGIRNRVLEKNKRFND